MVVTYHSQNIASARLVFMAMLSSSELEGMSSSSANLFIYLYNVSLLSVYD